MRINARLENDYAEKLEYLKKQTQLSTTEIVKQAIDLLYRQSKSKTSKKIKALLESDFIGCGEGPEDLSTHYKQYLTESLAKKHDLD